jgi:hypothetical protein
MADPVTELIKKISEINSGYRIGAFVICGLIIVFQLAINKKSKQIPVTIIITTMILIALFGLVPILAEAYLKLHSPRQEYKINVNFIDASSNTLIRKDAKISTQPIIETHKIEDSYEIRINKDELPNDSTIKIFAEVDGYLQGKVALKLGQGLILDTTISLRKSMSSDTTHKDDKRTFSLNINDKYLIDFIQKNTNLRASNISPYFRIEIVFDPNYIKYASSSNTYYFENSHPLIRINGHNCMSIDGCSIESSAYLPQKNMVEEYALNQTKAIATNYLRSHPKIIVSCLK